MRAVPVRRGDRSSEPLTGRTLVSVAVPGSATRAVGLAWGGDTELDVIVTVELGDSSYLVASGDEAVVVDPQRDAWRFVAAAEARRATIRHVLETHVHNDYVSGAHEIRAATGAEIAAPARRRLRVPAPRHGRRRRDRGRRRHVYGVADARPHARAHCRTSSRAGGADDPVAVFTGGSLMVGARRPNRPARARPHRRADPGAVPLARPARRRSPTRSGCSRRTAPGSFCSAGSGGGARTSTIGGRAPREPGARVADEDDFVRLRTHELPRHPAYYRFMAPINRAGPRRGRRAARRCRRSTPPEVERLVAAGARVVDDARPRRVRGGAHPGSVNIELGGSFSAYVGWLFTPEQPLVAGRPRPRARRPRERAATQLFRIGFDGSAGTWPAGWMPGGRRTAPSRRTRSRASRSSVARLRDGRARSSSTSASRSSTGRACTRGATGCSSPTSPAASTRSRAIARRGSSAPAGCGPRSAASLLDAAGRPVRLVAERGVTDLLAECPPAGPVTAPRAIALCPPWCLRQPQTRCSATGSRRRARPRHRPFRWPESRASSG